MTEYERGKADGAQEIRERVEAVLDEHAAHHPQLDASTYYMGRVRVALDGAAP